MRDYKQGIQLSPAEVTCLLAFTGDDCTRPHLWGACFQVESGNLTASATNGHVGVQGTEERDHELEPDVFFIRRPDLELLKSVCKGNRLVSVHRLGFTLLEENKETTEAHELGDFTFDEPATQLDLFPAEGIEKVLSRANEKAPTTRGMFAGPYFRLGELLAKAACAIGTKLTYPDDPGAGLHMEARGPGDVGTAWRAVIMPMRDDEIEDAHKRRQQAEAPAEDPQNPAPLELTPTQKAGVAKAVGKFVDNMQRMADETGTTVSIQTPGNEPVEIAAPGKGRKGKRK